MNKKHSTGKTSAKQRHTTFKLSHCAPIARAENGHGKEEGRQLAVGQLTGSENNLNVKEEMEVLRKHVIQQW